MKKFLLVTLLLLPPVLLPAWRPKPSFGLEWGYTGTFLHTHQHNYIYSAGSRIIDEGAYWWYYSNGSIMANAGLDVSRSVNVSVYSGLLGVYSRRWVVPLELRTRWCPSGLTQSGAIVHAGIAAVFPTSTLKETAGRLNIGGGYRFKVFRHISVDFLLSFNLTGDHDLIRDPDTGKYVLRSDILRNYSEYWGINASVALNF